MATQAQAQPSATGPEVSPAPSEPLPYSGNQFRRDAALILVFRDEYDATEDNQLGPLITDGIYGRASGIQDLTTPDNRDLNTALARQRIEETDLIHSLEMSREFIRNFVRGPVMGPASERIRADPALDRNQKDKERHGYSGQPSRKHGPFRPLSQSFEEEIPRSFPPAAESYRHQTSRTTKRYQPPPREASLYPHQHGTYPRYSPPRRSPPRPRYEPYQSRSPPQTQTQRSPPRGRYSRRLKPTDIGEYNGVSSVALFVQRITSMVNRYGRDEVLEVLPLYIKDLAKE
jgi:hypothetical protein